MIMSPFYGFRNRLVDPNVIGDPGHHRRRQRRMLEILRPGLLFAVEQHAA